MKPDSNPKKLINIVVGLIFFYLLFRWLTDFNIVGNYLAPQVESGKLGAGNANTLASVSEVVLSVLGTVGLFWIRIGTWVSGMVTDAIRDFFPTKQVIDEKEAFVQRQVENDMYNLLGEMVERKNASMVVELINELAGGKIVEVASVPITVVQNEPHQIPDEWKGVE